jgi:hypothetical protein
MICLGMHNDVMLRLMVQAFQDPPLCSSTMRVCVALVDSVGKLAYFSVTPTIAYYTYTGAGAGGGGKGVESPSVCNNRDCPPPHSGLFRRI